jgi:peptidoglycan hydrolase CwlO-like protein
MMQPFANINYLCLKQINMKYITAVVFSLAFYTVSVAQARLTTVEYQKINRQAVVGEVPFPEKTVRDAIDNKMEQMGYKGKDVKGFTVYKGVRLAALGKEAYDLYFAVDRKSRKEKDYSTVTFMISKGIDNFVADSTDASVMRNGKEYVDTLKNSVDAYDLEQQIIPQEALVKKADKKYSDLMEEGQSLEKKRNNIEKDIEENKSKQTSQQTEIEKQKQILETLKGRRKH